MSELTQYSYVIHDASQTFPWENVYGYDIIFRRQMNKFPERNWGIILQQAWTFKMRQKMYSGSGGSSAQKGKIGNGKRDVCWKFNSGKCTYGLSCKFDHRCAFCFKFGHGSHNCCHAVQSIDSIPEHESNRRRENYEWDRQDKQDKYDRNDRYHYTRRDFKPTQQ